MKEITVGQYYPGNSLLHQLDPRVKLLGTVIFSISVFMVNNYIGYSLVLILTTALIFLSRVPPAHILKTVSSALLFALFISVFQIFFTHGNPIVTIGWFSITDQGLVEAALLSFRLVILVLGTSIITFCTTPKDLTNGMEKGLSCLKKVHIPVQEISMAMFIAIRFIPVLSEESQKIKTAQISRGRSHYLFCGLKRIEKESLFYLKKEKISPEIYAH